MGDYKGKRTFDIVISSVSLIVLSPIFLITCILIRVFDNGPIFFKQYRIGKNNKRFLIIKFRSLPIQTPNLPSEKIGKIKIKWVGRFIRRTSIDELPQLINILKGEMSIVGPRPPLESQKDLIIIREKNGSINCLPGLTGLAQINAFNNMSYLEKAKYDGIYYKNISFLMDLMIIMKTFRYLLTPPPIC